MFNYLIPHFISQEAVFALSFLRLITASNKAASTERPPIQGAAFSVSRNTQGIKEKNFQALRPSGPCP